MNMPPVQEEQEKPSTSMLKERRFKLSRACDRCRRRRIKCDEGHPCQACLTASSPCTFEEPGKRTHPHKSKRTATLEDRMHHLETLIQAIPPAVFAAGGALPGLNAGIPQLSDPNSTGPLASISISNNSFPSGVPPPSLHVFPLTNPSTHFTTAPVRAGERQQSPNTAFRSMLGQNSNQAQSPTDQLAEQASRMSLSAASYLYFDDEGYTRWQGETSGLPLLDLLVEHHAPANTENELTPDPSWSDSAAKAANFSWFPNRQLKRTSVNPETIWRFITSCIVPELMDSLVQCYLCTSYYILPFLHVPTFLADYGNPRKWGEPGFAAFIVSVCCLASRHMDDPRVRADPNDGISAGTQWFELFGRLRTLPIADHPTLYTIQANLIAAVYAVGLGKLSKAAALLSEAITVSIDAGLHRSADTYDLFDPIEDEVRKRTFWCVYLWDKQLSAHFGRPPMLRLRDCDVGEPSIVDDEFITHDGMASQPARTESRMSAFIAAARIMVVMESVLDVPSAGRSADSSHFLLRAAGTLAGHQPPKDLREEETLLDEIRVSIPAHWAHTTETLASEDVIRVTQAVRLHCAEHFVRMLIHRHRLSNFAAERAFNHGVGGEDMSELERETMAAAQMSAIQIITSHMQVAAKGLMTYYGVHVIHQLTQAGRTLVAILLNCKSENLQALIQPSLDALRSCIGLLRRFSGRYVCGLRSGDLMEEFCRLTQIPLEPIRQESPDRQNTRPPWIRPVRKKAQSVARGSSDTTSQHSSPESFSPSDFFVDPSINITSPSKNPPHSAFPVASSSSVHSTQLQSTNQPYSNGGRRSSVSVPPFIDTSVNMDLDNGMYVPPAEMMAMFNEGSMDVSSLFSPDFALGQSSTDAHDSVYGSLNGSGSAGAMGLVSTP